MNWINEVSETATRCMTGGSTCPTQGGCSFCFINGSSKPVLCVLNW